MNITGSREGGRIKEKGRFKSQEAQELKLWHLPVDNIACLSGILWFQYCHNNLILTIDLNFASKYTWPHWDESVLERLIPLQWKKGCLAHFKDYSIVKQKWTKIKSLNFRPWRFLAMGIKSVDPKTNTTIIRLFGIRRFGSYMAKLVLNHSAEVIL